MTNALAYFARLRRKFDYIRPVLNWVKLGGTKLIKGIGTNLVTLAVLVKYV